MIFFVFSVAFSDLQIELHCDVSVILVNFNKIFVMSKIIIFRKGLIYSRLRVVEMRPLTFNCNSWHCQCRQVMGSSDELADFSLTLARSGSKTDWLMLLLRLPLRSRVQDEDGYVLYVRKNALQILIPKYGLEGTLFLRCDAPGVSFTYNEKEQSQSCGSVVFHSFDPVTVQLSLDRSNVQHEKLVLQLVRPEIAGFSVASTGSAGLSTEAGEPPKAEIDAAAEQPEAKKRKKHKKKK